MGRKEEHKCSDNDIGLPKAQLSTKNEIKCPLLAESLFLFLFSIRLSMSRCLMFPIPLSGKFDQLSDFPNQ